MDFRAELERTLPADLPNRAVVVEKSARHLRMIVEVNEYMNLTRITTVREAVIKHMLDSLLPWKLFEGAKHVLDAGTGAGFPGIPLALVFPQIQFTLADSVQKKARFVQTVVDELQIHNVTVAPARAEDLLKNLRVDCITARAMAPLSRAAGYFAPGLKNGAIALLYKGPDAESEIAEAAAELRRHKLAAKIVERYELPDSLGVRTVIRLS